MGWNNQNAHKYATINYTALEESIENKKWNDQYRELNHRLPGRVTPDLQSHIRGNGAS
jgi:hypothetical protein